jgi:hypothetical protein
MMFRVLAVTSLLVICTVSFGATGGNIAHSRVSWNGTPVDVVSINLNSPDLKVTVSLAKNGTGTSESFASMLGRVKPDAAITGTFFCTRSLKPTGDIVIEGTRIHTGSVGTGVCFTPKNTVEFVPYAIGHRTKWQGYDTVLCAGPTLVKKGKMFLTPRDQGFRDPGLFGRKKRTALGVTANNKLLLVVPRTPMQLRTLAKVMLSLGAVEAVDLDGGSSSALHCNGKLISRPGRRLTNLLVVYGSLTDYYHHRLKLAPGLGRTVASMPTSFSNPFADYAPYRAPTLTSGFPVVDLFMPARYEIAAPVGDETHLATEEAPAEDSGGQLPILPQAEAVLNTGNQLPVPTVTQLKPARRSSRSPQLAIADNPRMN